MSQRLEQIQIRDPYVLTLPASKEYLLFGSTDENIWSGPATGFDCYRSNDLLAWEGPFPAFRPAPDFWSKEQYWAPEVHPYEGRYYMFATFTAPGRTRGTQILSALQPAGPYEPWSNGPVTPAGWECLDGTLHVDQDGAPWLVFCHEWKQIDDGAVVAQRLSHDLRRAEGEPRVLFTASEAPWSRPLDRPSHSGAPLHVTDGPFLHRLASGNLIMLWSSFGEEGYAMGIARSRSGTVLGPWTQEPEALWSKDGGHGMIARKLDGSLFLTLHQPNRTPHERAAFFPLRELEDTVVLQPTAGTIGAASGDREAIDREALVSRHNVRQHSLDPRSPVSVGNGEFAFTMDLTGLQTFPGLYPVGARDELPPGTLLGTQAQWAWHSVPPAEPYTLADSTVLYDSPRGPVPYVDMVGDIVNDRETDTSAGETWLRANPHRLDLGRIGFRLIQEGQERTLAPSDVTATEQTLDLWTGTVTSRFTLAGHPVKVTTACHPDVDELGLRVESPALGHGLLIGIDFPYGSEAWHDAADWTKPEAHTTLLDLPADAALHDATSWVVHRELDDSRYAVVVTGSGLGVEQAGQHSVRISTERDVMDLSVAFLSAGDGDCIPRGNSMNQAATAESRTAKPGADVVRSPELEAGSGVAAASAAWWPQFWYSGGAIELDANSDPRAKELERRIVLSQYLTTINCSGSLPPQETGLVCNSWRGRFHLEMHWWHAAHFAHWNRVELLLPSLRWYSTILDAARQTARQQGFEGVRWPKQVGPDGRESPSTIGTFLIWQQPHPIYLAELVYRANPGREVLEEFAEIVFESAAFMASFAHRTSRGFELGPPLIPAQESYGSIRSTVTNPTFELAYWQWGLQTAATWRERLGLEPVPSWLDVAEGMVPPRVVDGVYAAIDVEPFTIRTDHPSMLCALGVLPQTGLIDPEVMRATLKDVLADWDWGSTWGWDYPVMAMTAARLGDPEAAVDALLLEAGKNTVLPNGHNRQTDSLPLYLPGNGGLLAAAALMAAGWDNGPDRHAPGFPADWTVAWEGLVRSP